MRTITALAFIAASTWSAIAADECNLKARLSGIVQTIAASSACPQFDALSKVDYPSLILIGGVDRKTRDDPWCWLEIEKQIEAEKLAWKKMPLPVLKKSCEAIEGAVAQPGSRSVYSSFGMIKEK